MKIEELLENVQVGKETTLSVVEALDAAGEVNGRKLVVEARALNAEAPRAPVRAESPRRCHVFHDAEGFGEYLGTYGGKNTVILADVPNSNVAAVLDEKSATGFEVLRFEPQIHPLWAPWAALIRKTVALPEFIDFLLHNRRAVVAGRDLIMSLSQVKASTSIELQRGRGKKSLNGLMVKTLIQGTLKDEIVELPDSITVSVPIFVATEPKQLDLDLTIEGTDDGSGIVCSLASGDLLAAKIEAFEEMLGVLRKAALPAVIGYGRPAHDGWQYLAETAK